MSNSAIITTKEKRLAIYLQWEGDRSIISAFLAYCELQGYDSPSSACSGWARLCQVIINYTGGSHSVGIDTYEQLHARYDNGTYVIDGWKIVGREDLEDGFVERDLYDLYQMLETIDACMPDDEQLGLYPETADILFPDSCAK